jgi:hypothetical protein
MMLWTGAAQTYDEVPAAAKSQITAAASAFVVETTFAPSTLPASIPEGDIKRILVSILTCRDVNRKHQPYIGVIIDQ